MKKILIKIAYILFFASFLLCLQGRTFASSNSNEQLIRFNDKEGYYYIGEDGELFTSMDSNLLRRINDTYFFTDYQGRVYAKYNTGYGRIIYNYLDCLLGKKLDYENLKDKNLNMFPYYNMKFELTKTNLLTNEPKENAIYVNHPNNASDICLVGDSYAYNLAYYTGKNIEYSVKYGYVVSAVKNELLPLIDWTGIKYCILFVGPNDLMCLTDFASFEADIKYICDYVKARNATPVFASYLGIDNFSSVEVQKTYSAIIENVTKTNGGIFIDVEDIDKFYKRKPYDLVHPDKDFYKPAYERIYSNIKINSFQRTN